MWEPFAAWVSTDYPHDATVMYTDASYSQQRGTAKSNQLWQRHTKGYVKAVEQGTAGQ